MAPWKQSELAAWSTSGWLAQYFRFDILHSEILDHHIDELKRYGGIDDSSLCYISNGHDVISGLTETSPLYNRRRTNRGSFSGYGCVTTEQVIAAFARLSIMGFSSEPFNRLMAAFPEVTKQMTKVNAIVPDMLLYALWHDTWKKRGDYFTFPLKDGDQREGRVVTNNAGTHWMYEGVDNSGDGVLVFAPVNITPKNLDILCRDANSSAARDGLTFAKLIKKTKGGAS